MKSTPKKQEPEVLFFHQQAFNEVVGDAQRICTRANEVLSIYYESLKQRKLKPDELPIIQQLINGSGTSQIVDRMKTALQNDMKGLHTLVIENAVNDFISRPEIKAFIKKAETISRANSWPGQYGYLPWHYFFIDENGLMTVDSEGAKGFFTSYISSPARAEFIQIGENIASELNKLFEMQMNAGDFTYKINLGEYFDRISEMLVIEEGKLIFNRSYLHTSNL